MASNFTKTYDTITMVNEIKISILIVLYNKELSESKTINSLSSLIIKDLSIVIHNNGPKLISLPDNIRDIFSDKGCDVSISNTIDNQPLSVIYNDFVINNNQSDRFVILDDDSEISQVFINAMYLNDYDVELPKIISDKDNSVYYPISNGVVIDFDGYVNASNTISIGSGLIINKTLVRKFQKEKICLFDERYALYGVDFSFFRRVWMLHRRNIDFKMKSSSFIFHSLSRINNKDSLSVKNERLIDFCLTVRHYPTIPNYFKFICKVLIELFFLRFNRFNLMCTTYFSGLHPRCVKK